MKKRAFMLVGILLISIVMSACSSNSKSTTNENETTIIQAGINPDTKMKDLTEEELGKIREQLDHYTIEGDLRRETSLNIKALRENGSYRGLRHKNGLPVRGQNTKNNARTRKSRKG